MKFKLLFLLFIPLMGMNLYAQEIPLVYDVENTGIDYPDPVLPTINELPIVEPLPDPFLWSDGSGRDTTFASWSQRRSEIKAEIENYEIGPKPDRPDSIIATYENNTLTVVVTVNGKTLTLSSKITLPAGDGPFPAIIGMNSGSGSLPSDIFSSRNIAMIPFWHDQVVTYNNKSITDPYFQLYPDLLYSGEYAPWAWGVSRLIDGLELVQDVLPIDLKHLAVTGCSYAGKMALFSGAFDERIALTIAQESGGGGAAAWRVSETLGNVETLGATSHQWFMESMFKFSGSNVAKLPHDHHELMAMVAPRALLVFGNPDYTWLADESGYVSCRAAQKVWDNFGISERFGFSIVGGHGHCQLPNGQRPELEAFVDKFMLGDTTANTSVAIHPYDYVDYSRWTEWWGTDNPVFPERNDTNTVTLAFEAECGTVGSNWNTEKDPGASNEYYVTVKPGIQSLSEAPSGADNLITIPFELDTTGNFSLFARLNCPSPDDDSFWLKMDDEAFSMFNGLGTNGWEWIKFTNYTLTPGEHTLTIGYREDGAKMDKISLSTFPYAPSEMGIDAEDLCEITEPVDTSGVGIYRMNSSEGFSLGYNYPNPSTGKTNIPFVLPHSTYVSLKVFNMNGKEISELAGTEFSQGKHTLVFDASGLPNGMYFYTLKADNFSASQKMILQNE